MCGLCKLNAAALDTTTACGYNGIDQHNLGLLPPIAGIDMIALAVYIVKKLLPPIAGIDMDVNVLAAAFNTIAPHRGD